jgi:ABC-type hemin transport system substrate-binding protein
MSVTVQDREELAAALYSAYASGDSPGPIPPLEEQTPTTIGRWRTVADAVLTKLAPDAVIVDKAVAWRTVMKNLSHAPEAPERLRAHAELLAAVDASGQ